MPALSTNTKTSDPINVFLIGNNPIELSNIYEKLKEYKNNTYKAEISFDLKGLYKRIINFNPSCILIDDNLSRTYLNKLVKYLANNKQTRDIAITILKNSNYRDTHVSDAQDYILKDTITPESLSSSILSSIKFKKMHRYLYRSYKRGQSRIKDLFG